MGILHAADLAKSFCLEQIHEHFETKTPLFLFQKPIGNQDLRPAEAPVSKSFSAALTCCELSSHAESASGSPLAA